MGGQDAYATGTSAGNGLRHQPFLATEVCIIVGAVNDPYTTLLANATKSAIRQGDRKGAPLLYTSKSACPARLYEGRGVSPPLLDAVLVYRIAVHLARL